MVLGQSWLRCVPQPAASSRRADFDPTISLRQARTSGLGMLLGGARARLSGSKGPSAPIRGYRAPVQSPGAADRCEDLKAVVDLITATQFRTLAPHQRACGPSPITQGVAYQRTLWSSVGQALAACRAKLSRMACHPSLCCSMECSVSGSKDTRTTTLPAWGTNSTTACRSPKSYSIRSFITIFV